jgi:replication initiation and membrane attachment protein DnaB
MKIFKLISKELGHKFSFHAKNIAEANSKKNEWARYHSHSTQDYVVEETSDPKWLHNEYFD